VTSDAVRGGESSLNASEKVDDIGVKAAVKKFVPKHVNVSLSMIDGMSIV